MFTVTRTLGSSRRRLIIGTLLAILCAAIALGVGNYRGKSTGVGVFRDEHVARRSGPVVSLAANRTSQPLAMPQTGGQFDLSQSVIAGGGDSSSGGNFTLAGTIGESGTGTVMSGGNFVQAGGFSYAITSGPLPSPAATPTPTPAPNFIVNSLDDSVDANPGDGTCETAPGNAVCTLRAAIQEAPAGNAIGFALPPASIIKLTNGELLINKNLTINGPGANLLNVQRSAVVGTPQFRIFNIAAGAVSLSGLTISNGISPGNRGGGIYDGSTDVVSVSNVAINGNSANQGNGGGIHIESTGTLNVVSSIISGNTAADGGGGGISNVRGTVNISGSSISNNSGHGIYTEVSDNAATITVTNSTLSGNVVSNQVRGGGGISNAITTNTGTITVTVTNSTISGNSVGNDGGGIQNFIFGSVRSGPTINLNVLNSTISGNSGGSGGGIYISSANPVTVNLTDSTIAGNSAGGGGGIADSGGGGMVIVKNSIIARNTANSDPDVLGGLTSLGYNLIGNGSGAIVSPANQTGDQIGTPGSPIDPLLGSLQDNGGPTFTRALLAGSPAIDKGNSTTADQRGLPRPVDDLAIPNSSGGNGSDIGAFEVQAPAPTPTPTPSPSPTPTPSCVNVAVSTGLTALKNATLVVPLNASDMTGKGIISFDFTLSYDANVLAPLATSFDQTGTLSSGFTVTVNSNTAGQLVVSGFGTAPLSGTGVLLKLKFNVIGSAPSCSNLNLSNFHFNEGTPCTSTVNGQACVINGAISGVIRYGTGSGSAFVPDTTLSAAGTPNANATTDENGAYQLSGLGSGPYGVTPAKSGDINGITAFDAALVAQHVVGLITLNANQQTAADASDNGTITSFDAALIAQTAVGLANPGIAGAWKFVPTSRTYQSTIADLPNQDYDAILIGDVSGNWIHSAGNQQQSLTVGSSTAPSIPVVLPNQTGPSGATVILPIFVTNDLAALNVISYDLDIVFDPSVLQPEVSATNATGTLSNGMAITANTNIPGHIKVAAYGSTPLVGAGTILNLRFRVVGGPGATTPLTQSFAFNEGDPGTQVINGRFSVSSPTAAAVNISGLVTTSDGAFLGGVVISLSGGDSRMTITDAYGVYHFDNLETGGFYTVAPQLVNYTFSPAQRSFSLLGNKTDAVFVATADSAASGSPLDTSGYFVRQHYLDFLGREPDQDGFAYWSAQLNGCHSDAACDRAQRIAVSNAFFYEQEYQQTGSFVFRLYRVAYGNNQPLPNSDNSNQVEAKKLPGIATFARDRARVIAGSSMTQSQVDLANDFVQRPEFTAAYPVGLDGSHFVDALLTTIKNDSGADLTLQRETLIDLLNTGGRGNVLYRLADDNGLTSPVNNRAFIDAEYNRALVFTAYAGYLRRDSDIDGFLFWLGQVDSGKLRDVAKQRALVCSFLTSAEYQQRFSAILTHSNAECVR